MTTFGDAPWPRWATRLAACGATLAAALIGLWLAVLQVVSSPGLRCGLDFSEDTILAPASVRARLLCSGDAEAVTVRPEVMGVLLAVVVVLAGAVLVAFWRGGRGRPVTVLATALVLGPTVLLLAVQVLPADCSDARWREHGAAGCERSGEAR